MLSVQVSGINYIHDVVHCRFQTFLVPHNQAETPVLLSSPGSCHFAFCPYELEGSRYLVDVGPYTLCSYVCDFFTELHVSKIHAFVARVTVALLSWKNLSFRAYAALCVCSCLVDLGRCHPVVGWIVLQGTLASRVSVFVYLGCMPRSGVAGSCGTPVFSLLRSCRWRKHSAFPAVRQSPVSSHHCDLVILS